MRRREFMAVLCGAAAWPLAARGQSSPKLRIIGVLAGASDDSARPQSDSFRQGLRDLGYVEGVDFELVYRSAGGKMQRLPSLAEDLVRLRPDAILAVPTPATVAASAASKTIPIVSFMLTDEVRLGLVANVARPGGNVTGLAMRVDGMAGKLFELAAEAVPGARRIGIVVNATSVNSITQLREVSIAATALNVDRIVAEIRQPEDVEFCGPAFGGGTRRIGRGAVRRALFSGTAPDSNALGSGTVTSGLRSPRPCCRRRPDELRN